MEKFFRLNEHGTTVRTEIVAGLTTFMTMAYIVALNPNLLTGFATGTPLWNAVFLATCIASAVGSAFMALLANKPFVMAPGMGLNTFFALVVSNIAVINGVSYGDAFRSGLCIIFFEGVIFVILSLANIREKIVDSIPLGIRLGIGPSIGLLLMNIGFGSNLGIYAEGNGYSAPFYVMRDFFGSMTPGLLRDAMGAEYRLMVLSVATMFVGLLVIVLLSKKGLKAAVLLGMLASSVLYWAGEAFLGLDPFAPLKTASFVPPFADLARETLFRFDFAGFFDIGVFTAVTLIITFCLIDMFDTIGTFIGAASKSGMTDENGKMPRMKEALLSDAIGTLAGSVTGTSTVSTYVESASGVEAGGRTGLTSLTASLAFLSCIFLAPVAAVIPATATSAALVYVGILMLQGLSRVDFNDPDQLVPVFVMLLAMPVSGSIGHGIGIAMILYTLIKLFSGKAREVSALTYVISVLFLIKFFAIV